MAHLRFFAVLIFSVILNSCTPDVTGLDPVPDNLAGKITSIDQPPLGSAQQRVVVASGAGWLVPTNASQHGHSITFDFSLEMKNGTPFLKLNYVDRDPPATIDDEDPDGFRVVPKEGETPIPIVEDDSSMTIVCPIVRTPISKKKSQYTTMDDLALIRIRDNGRGKHKIAPDELEIIFGFSLYSSSGIVGGGDIRIIAPDALTQSTTAIASF